MQAFLRPLAIASALCLSLALVSGAQAQGVNGTLGLFFDDRGQDCSTTLATGRTATLWVLLLPEGDTRGGINGAEFSIDTSGAPGYVFSKEEVRLPNGFYVGGPAVGSGLIIVSTSGCERGAPIPLMRLQVQNVGGGRDGVVSIAPKDPPSNREFPCPLVLLCDSPAFTKVCMEIGPKNIAVLNPSGAIPCGIAAEDSEWGAVKELYR
jgi:hypothetical protein